MTPEIEVGTIASIDVAAALRCVSPSHTSAGTITVPPPMPNMPDSSPTATPTITSTAMPRADSSSPAGSAPNSRSAFPPNFPLGCTLDRTLDRTLSSARSTLSAFEILEISDFFISPLPSHFFLLAIIAIVAIVHSHTSQRRKTGRIREGRRETTPACRTSGARQPRDRLSRCARAATAVPAIRTRIQ
ncbi:unknown [Bifidobacterium pseudocatenulatum CAG:263]|nr:unknown [Bifidobacterium pseudocatenulatum CAG:263]